MVEQCEAIYFNSAAMRPHMDELGVIDFSVFAALVFRGQTAKASIQDLSREFGVTTNVIAKSIRRLAQIGWLSINGSGAVRTIAICRDVAISEGHWQGRDARVGGRKRIACLWEAKRQGVNASVRRRILRRDGERCRYCGSENGPWHIDHRVAVALGGTDAESNLVVACASCNRSKGALTLREWQKRNG